MKSWKTTLFGVLTILGSAISLIALPLLDGDPATGAQFGTFIPFLTTGIAALLSRDNDKSSEAVGTKK